MGTLYVTSRAIIEVLEAIGELEWARAGGILSDGSQMEFPPFVVWRFKEPVEATEKKIIEAIESFEGRVKWQIYSGKRNWVIEPERVRQFFDEKGYKVDSHARADISKLEPELGRAANQDLPYLAEYIRKKVLDS